MKKCPKCKEKALNREFNECVRCGGYESWLCDNCLTEFEIKGKNGVGEEI